MRFVSVRRLLKEEVGLFGEQGLIASVIIKDKIKNYSLGSEEYPQTIIISKMQKFKEIPHQNYIELRFNNKNINELNEQELLVRYKRNSAVLGKIFSFTRDQTATSEQHTTPSQPTITPQLLEKYIEQANREQQQSRKKVEEVHERAKLFDEFIQSSQKIRTQEELTEMLEKLKQNSMYDHTHPFLNESSPFYLNSTEAEMLAVEKKEHYSESLFSEDGMVFEDIL